MLLLLLCNTPAKLVNLDQVAKKIRYKFKAIKKLRFCGKLFTAKPELYNLKNAVNGIFALTDSVG